MISSRSSSFLSIFHLAYRLGLGAYLPHTSGREVDQDRFYCRVSARVLQEQSHTGEGGCTVQVSRTHYNFSPWAVSLRYSHSQGYHLVSSQPLHRYRTRPINRYHRHETDSRIRVLVMSK